MAVEADDVEEGMGVGAFRSGNQGQRNGEDGGRGIKSLGKETQGQTHGGQRYGRRVTRRDRL